MRSSPRPDYGQANPVIGLLLGIASLERQVRAMAVSDPPHDRTADDFVDALVGVAALGERVRELSAPLDPAANSPLDEGGLLR